MAFHHSVTARFNDIDRAGIVFFARFFEYCHATFEELITAMFGDLEKSFLDGVWSMPLVHAEADYAHPVRLGDRLDISVQVLKLGHSSVTCAYHIAGNDGSPRARVTLVHVCIDPQTSAKRSVPDAFRDGLERLGLLPR